MVVVVVAGTPETKMSPETLVLNPSLHAMTASEAYHRYARLCTDRFLPAGTLVPQVG